MVNDQETLYCELCTREEPSKNEDLNNYRPTFEKLNDFLKTKGLKLFHQNINGQVNKIDYVGLMLKETRGKTDILGLTKIHLCYYIIDEEIVIDGFTFIRKDRLSGPRRWGWLLY